MVREEEDVKMYIYDLKLDRYAGFFSLTKILGINEKIPLDFIIVSDRLKPSLIFYANDDVFLVSQGSLESKSSNPWSIIKKIPNMNFLNSKDIFAAKIFESSYSRLYFLINNKYLISRNRFVDL